MSVAFSDLTTRLSDLVPAQNGTPSPTQYEDAVRDAVYAFSEKAGLIRMHEFAVVSGAAAYTLPDDFLHVIKLEPLFGGVRYGNVAVTGEGIVPLANAKEEEYTVNGHMFTLYPTPTYSAKRWLKYKAAHITDDQGSYPYMTDHMAGIVILKAQAYGWRVVGSRVGRQGWKYTFGDVTIDKSNLGKSLNTWVADFETDFEERVKRFVGPVGQLSG